MKSLFCDVDYVFGYVLDCLLWDQDTRARSSSVSHGHWPY